MTVWFTADPHFGHKNIIEYCDRPFSSAGDMDFTLIENWNKVVRPLDTVYLLGDVTFGGPKVVRSYFSQLVGWIRVVPGGHDHNWNKKKEVYYSASNTVDILSDLCTVKVAPKTEIVLCHFPLESWDGAYYDVVHLHGHSHGKSRIVKNRIDVGVDRWNFTPVSLEQIQALIVQRTEQESSKF